MSPVADKVPAAGRRDAHRVGELVFDFEVTQPGGRFLDADQMAWALRGELLSAVEGAFEDFSAAGADIRLDRLELDLGELHDELGWPEIRQELRARLLSALEMRGTAVEQRETPQRPTDKRAAEYSSREAVLRGLADSRSAMDTLASLEALRQHDPDRWLALTRTLLSDGHRLREIAEGLPVEWLRRLVLAVLPQAGVADAVQDAGRDHLLDHLTRHLGAGHRVVEEPNGGARIEVDIAGLAETLLHSKPDERGGLLADLRQSGLVDLLGELSARAAEDGLQEAVAERISAVPHGGVRGEGSEERLPPGAALLAQWRRDPVAFSQAVFGRSAAELAELLRTVAPHLEPPARVSTDDGLADLRRALVQAVLGSAGFDQKAMDHALSVEEIARLLTVWRADPGALVRFLDGLSAPELTHLAGVLDRLGVGAAVGKADVSDLTILRERLRDRVLGLTAEAPEDLAELVEAWRHDPALLGQFAQGKSRESLVARFRTLAHHLDWTGDVSAIESGILTADSIDGAARIWHEAADDLIRSAKAPEAGAERDEVAPVLDASEMGRLAEIWRRDARALRRFVETQGIDDLARHYQALARFLGKALPVQAPVGDSQAAGVAAADRWLEAFAALLGAAPEFPGRGVAVEAHPPMDAGEIEGLLARWAGDPAALRRFAEGLPAKDLRHWVSRIERVLGVAGMHLVGRTADVPEWREALFRLVEEYRAQAAGAALAADAEVSDTVRELRARLEAWRSDPGHLDARLREMGAGSLKRLFSRVVEAKGAPGGRYWLRALEREAASAEVWRAAAANLVTSGPEAAAWEWITQNGGLAGIQLLVGEWRRAPAVLERFAAGKMAAELEAVALAAHRAVGGPVLAEGLRAASEEAAQSAAPAEIWLRLLRQMVGAASDNALPEASELPGLIEHWRQDIAAFERFAAKRSAEQLRALACLAGRVPEAFPGQAKLLEEASQAAEPVSSWRRYLEQVSNVIGPGDPELRQLAELWRRDRPAFERFTEGLDARRAEVLLGKLREDGAGTHTEWAELIETKARSVQPDGMALSGPELVEHWRVRGAEFKDELARLDVHELRDLLGRALSQTGSDDRPPLCDASVAAAERSADAAAFLAEVLRGIVADEPLDLDAIGAAVERAVKSGEHRAFGFAELLALLDDRSGPPIPGLAELIAVFGVPGRIQEALGDTGRGLRRASHLLSLLGRDGMRRIAAGLSAGSPQTESVAGILWQTVPEKHMVPELRDASMWQFVLLHGDGYFPRTGGVTGLVDTALNWLARDRDRRDEIARALIGRLDDMRVSSTAGLAAQVVAGLMSITGGRPQAEVAAEPSTGLTKSAGLVLLSPYLPQLFQRLGLLEDGAFAGPEAIGRAFDALNFMIHGDGLSEPAPRPLERILCGLAPEIPLDPPQPVDTEARALLSGLLDAVLQQWTALGNTSADGLREAFLRREGLIGEKPDGFRLRVMPKAYDMLLDRLPWSYTLVKYAWMPKPLHVIWRNTDE